MPNADERANPGDDADERTDHDDDERTERSEPAGDRRPDARSSDDDDVAPTGPRARLSFARDFPESPALDEMLAAFDRGDYARVRALAPGLASNERPEVARAARDIARRIEPDRSIVAMMAISVALLATLALWFWTHRLGAHP